MRAVGLLLAVLLPLAVLVTGCAEGEGYLKAPASPSVSLPERPGTSRAESSAAEEELSGASSEPSGQDPARAMRFEATEEPALERVFSRTGDLEVLGMTYGDGTYFVLSRREAGLYVTGYDGTGAGKFAGMLEDGDWELLGYAQGYACLYSASVGRSFACNAEGRYIWFTRESLSSVLLTPDGFAFVRGRNVTLCLPDEEGWFASYTLPEGSALLTADGTRAAVRMQDGSLCFLLPDGTVTGSLPEGFSAVGTASGFGLCCTVLRQTAVLSRPIGAFRVPDGGELLCCGADFAVLKSGDGLCLLLPGSGQLQRLALQGEFRFGGRTEDGLLFACGGDWYRCRMTEAEHTELTVLPYQPETVPGEADGAAACAAAVLCAASESLCGVKLAEDGAPFALSPAVAGFTARRETDGEALLLAAATLLETLPALPALPEELRAGLCVYLCGGLEVGTEAAEFLLFADGNATGLLLDVSRPEQLPLRLQAAWEQLQAG